MGPRLFSRGNFEAGLHAGMPPASFNGATTFQPWKYHGNASYIGLRRVASMGPRLFSRGNVGTTTPQSHTVSGFNGATTFQPWKWDAHHDGPARPVQASMGPRLFSRGNAHHPVHHPGRLVASMGPRLFSRGNNTSWKWPAVAVMELQWGHDFSAVEMLAFTNGSVEPEVLQWGHDFSAVEI